MIAWKIASRSVASQDHRLDGVGRRPRLVQERSSRGGSSRGWTRPFGRSGPSPQRPLYAKESWACVCLDGGTFWVDMALLPAPEGQGHVVMFEMPPPRLQRRERQALEAAIANLSGSLSNLTRLQRGKVLRVAMDQLLSVSA